MLCGVFEASSSSTGTSKMGESGFFSPLRPGCQTNTASYHAWFLQTPFLETYRAVLEYGTGLVVLKYLYCTSTVYTGTTQKASPQAGCEEYE